MLHVVCNCAKLGNMIRLRKSTVPPVYQLKYALSLLRSGHKEAVSRILKAKPLEPIISISVDMAQEMRTYWSDGYLGDPYAPVIVPENRRYSIHVLYGDVDKYTEEDLNRDMKQRDPRQHHFRHIADLDMYRESNEAVVVFRDLESQERYIAQASVVE